MPTKNKTSASGTQGFKDKTFDSKSKKLPSTHWVIFKNTWPSILLMFFTGLYSFIDDIFSITYASNSYHPVINGNVVLYDTITLIRITLSTAAPIFLFLEGIAFLFSVGSSVIYSRALSNNDEEKAKSIISTSFKWSLIISVSLIPLLLLIIKPWFSYQYNADAQIKETIWKMNFSYTSVLVFALPFLIFNQYISALLRSEFKNIITLLFIGLSLCLNLLFDYLFMGKFNMGVEGGAWATFLSWGMNSLGYLIYIAIRNKNTNVTLRNLFLSFNNIKLHHFILVVALGITPFMRNVSQAFTESIESNNLSKMSKYVYHGDPTIFIEMFSTIIVVFNVFLPIMFGFMQGLIPIFAYWYKKTKYSYMMRLLGSAFLQGIAIGMLSTFAMWFFAEEMFDIMKVKMFTFNYYKMKLQQAILIMGITLPFFAIYVVMSSYFMATKRIWIALLASITRGFIVVWIVMHFINDFIVHYSFVGWDYMEHKDNIFGNEFAIWWFYPISMISTIGIITIPFLLCMFLDKRKYKKVVKHV